MEQLKQWTAPLVQRWKELPSQSRLLTVAFALSAVVVLSVMAALLNRPRYAVLFSNLQQSDSGAIVEKLKEARVPYRIEAEGSAISVPADQVHELRLQMSSQGLPQGGTVGFEIFDKSSFGMTEFSQKLNRQRALQGELARTISQVESVEHARVLLVLPEERLYQEDRRDPTASIALKTKHGRVLDESQVAAIVHLVSSAVEGLKPENVTVIDSRGNLLSEGVGKPDALSLRDNGNQMRLVKEYEEAIRKDAQTMLDRALGPGKSVVRVRAELDFSQREVDRETYKPGPQGKGIVTQEQETVEKYSGSARPGAAPGVSSNLFASPSTGSGRSDGYERRETSNSYNVSREVERVRDVPGRVRQLSVAVLLDGQMNAQRLGSIRQMVATAVGARPSRGDQVSVEAMPFDNSQALKEEAELKLMERRDLILYWVKSGLAILLVLALLVILRAALRRPTYEPLQKALPPAEESPAMPILEALDSATPELPEAPVETLQEKETEVLDLARADPAETAQVIRTWLAERSSG